MLIDFNVACDEGTEAALGTKSWMAPELQVDGDDSDSDSDECDCCGPAMTHKCDIYSLGCTLAALMVRS